MKEGRRVNAEWKYIRDIPTKNKGGIRKINVREGGENRRGKEGAMETDKYIYIYILVLRSCVAGTGYWEQP